MNGNWVYHLVTRLPLSGLVMKSGTFGHRTRGGASTGEHLVPTGGDVLVMVDQTQMWQLCYTPAVGSLPSLAAVPVV